MQPHKEKLENTPDRNTAIDATQENASDNCRTISLKSLNKSTFDIPPSNSNFRKPNRAIVNDNDNAKFSPFNLYRDTHGDISSFKNIVHDNYPKRKLKRKHKPQLIKYQYQTKSIHKGRVKPKISPLQPEC